MRTEETKDKGDPTKSCCFGFEGSRMFEMMSACCGDRGGPSGCSTMMKDMMEKMRNKPCCPEGAEDDRPGATGVNREA